MEIFLFDGPRTGERVSVDVGPDSTPPVKLTLTDPPAEPLVVPPGTPGSTSYWHVDVKKGPDDPPIYQSGVRGR